MRAKESRPGWQTEAAHNETFVDISNSSRSRLGLEVEHVFYRPAFSKGVD